jgi:hypothetical protein
MDVFLGYMPSQNLHTLLTANFPEYFPSPVGYIPHKNRLTIPGYPHQMQVDDKNTMGTMPIFVHASKLTQETLKLGVLIIPKADNIYIGELRQTVKFLLSSVASKRYDLDSVVTRLKLIERYP